MQNSTGQCKMALEKVIFGQKSSVEVSPVSV